MRCKNGHTYDKEKGDCPQCKRELENANNNIFFDESIMVQPNDEWLPFDPFSDFLLNQNWEDKILQKEAEEERELDYDEEESWEQLSDLREITDLGNTLILLAEKDSRYRLFHEDNQIMLTFQMVYRNTPVILERTVRLNDKTALRTLTKASELLLSSDWDEILREEPEENAARVYSNLRKFGCDYRFTVSAYKNTHCYEKLTSILGRAICTSYNHDYKTWDKSHLAAEMETMNDIYQLTNDVVIKKEGEYPVLQKVEQCKLTLKRNIYYYDGFDSFDAEASVVIPKEKIQVIKRKLLKCGIMEVLIEKRKRPDRDIICDPNFFHSFYLDCQGLTFSYSDCNKYNNSVESEAFEKAEKIFLSLFRRYSK